MRTLTLLLLIGCTEGLDAGVSSRSLVAESFVFGRDVDGVSEGFDLDGFDSELGSAEGCGIPDYVAPNGEGGVDNSFAAILPAIELAGGQAIEELIQATINSGELLLMPEIVGRAEAQAAMDDPEVSEVPCVEVFMHRGVGQPRIGGHGFIVPGQTFDVSTEIPSGHIPCAELQPDGSVVGHGMRLDLPFQVFDEQIDLELLDTSIRLTPRETGPGWDGVVGGALEMTQLQEQVDNLDGIGDELPALLDAALGLRADLMPVDGQCTQMSVVALISTVPAWFFGEDAGEPIEEDTDL